MKKLLSLITFLLILPATVFAASSNTCFDLADTSSMLHMNGVDTSTTFTDETGKTWTAFSSAQIDTAQFKFGGASGLFDGTDDFIYAGDSADFFFGTGNFTIDLWIRFNSLAAQQAILCQNESATSWWGMTWTTDNLLHLEAETGGSTVINMTFSWTPSTNTWYHLSITRSGNDFKAFIDGTQIGSTVTDTDAMPDVIGGPEFGRSREASGGANVVHLNGWIDEARIIKGTAVWTANFTAPTAEYVSCPKPSFFEVF